MVFMNDSDRAADLACQAGIDVGLHLNLIEPFTGNGLSPQVALAQMQVARFLRLGRYAILFYHPVLRKAFRRTYDAQADEFRRLYGRAPSHVDGHRHLHLCSNMLLDGVIPKGQRVRRSFSFWPGEKPLYNRVYRRLIDTVLCCRYSSTDYFLALSQYQTPERLSRIALLVRTSIVELMTHPANPAEAVFLDSEVFRTFLLTVPLTSHGSRSGVSSRSTVTSNAPLHSRPRGDL